MNYYKEQLSQLTIRAYGKYFPQLMIVDGTGNKTKFLTLNEESIKEIQSFLDQVQRELKPMNPKTKTAL